MCSISNYKKRFWRPFEAMKARTNIKKDTLASTTFYSFHKFLFWHFPPYLIHMTQTHPSLCAVSPCRYRDTRVKKHPLWDKNQKKRGKGGGTLTKSYHKCTTTSFTHCHNHPSHTFLLISLTTLSAYWFSHTMHPKTHSLPFPARETSNDEKWGLEVFFSSKKSQTTELFGSIC